MKFKLLLSILIAVCAVLMSQDVNASEKETVEVNRANFYVAWGMVSLQNIEIANNTNETIQNPTVEVIYNNSYDREQRIAKLTLPIEIPANSSATYLKNGLNRLLVNTGGNAGMHTGKSRIKINPDKISDNIYSLKDLETSGNT